MKKRVTSILLSLLMIVTCITSINMDVKAEDIGENMDFSYLLTDDALIGYADVISRGVYLVEGNSIINKISSTKIGAGGITNASVKCEVAITSIVERQTSTGWARVTSWNQVNDYAFSAAISKSLTVGTGYYYRVRSTHYAASDVSTSCTSSLRM